MINFKKKTGFLLLLGAGFFSNAQNLDDLMKESEKPQTNYATATFKGTRLIHGHSIEAPSKGVLQLMFSHRFGTLQDPLYTFMGMNQASIRFGFDYGLTKKLAVGIGRSSGLGGTTPPPTYDFYAKYRVVTQSTGAKNFPVSISLLGATAIDTEHWPNDGIPRTNADRFSYTAQALIARKFNEAFSLQLMPTFLHRNLTNSPDQKNTILALGIGGRIKLNKRVAFTAEYYATQNNTLGAGFYNPVAVGFDIETGGHVFQIMFTNSNGLIEPQFLGQTSTNFFSGAKGIRMGFNFSRVFTLKENK